ncbi:MAG TPA: GNAT family N-acetyltransferase [Nannocystaceae bacterium]|nr:GNAT family N-acetyltransferase [Nannocystaceae bacterium]
MIVDLGPTDRRLLEAAARLLAEGLPQGWPTRREARREVEEMVDPGRIARGFVEEGELVGWAGALELYPNHVWELHPLVVRGDRRRQGVGRSLVRDVEEQVRRRGAHTLFVGTDDEFGETAIGEVELYPDVIGHLQRLQASGEASEHPFAFYRRLGYSLIGAVPDANGRGRPDILLARRLVDGTGRD